MERHQVGFHRGSGPEDEIAIIGMGCRFPGAPGLSEFWQLLCDEVDAIREVPADRWSTRAHYAPAPPKPGKTYSCWGGFLDQIDHFDPTFFGISAREANSIDPQQRLLLEVAWEALEDAGLTSEWLSGRDVSVFVGASSNDYLQLQSSGHNARGITAYTNSGGAMSIASNRLSYLLNLRGPSLTVDTACSSSLVAFHYACESLRRGESEAAIVGGVNVLLGHYGFIGFSQAHMLSPDGRCKSFDASGNGYVRAEGAGAVVLKPWRRALADGDPIQAVVVASGVNQDGRTAGMSLPNREAQAALLRDVYARAKLDPGHVGYIEAHGTGTAAGDPIEAGALGQILGRGRSDHDKLRIGSVKSNIGHLEPASGIAGVIKTVLAMKHRELPATLHFKTPNPAIDFEGLRLRVVSKREEWRPINGSPLLAGINSFGFGGTNAHVVLAEHRSPTPASTIDGIAYHIPSERLPNRVFDTSIEVPDTNPRLIPLSAKSDAGLKALAKSWKDWLTASDTLDGSFFESAAYTAALRRNHHDCRLAIVASSTEQLAGSIDAWLRGEKRREVSAQHVLPADRLKMAFVFNGMGSQWQGMGEELLRSEPVFRATLEEVDVSFQSLSSWSIIDRLQDDEFRSRLNEAAVTQPCIFAVQVGLAAVWKNWGVEPDFVVGHSVGEVAAAYASGVLSLADAVRVIYHRSRLQNTLRGHGRMLAVGLPPEMAESIVERYVGHISIAASNSPSSVTLSGDADILEEVRLEMEATQTFCRFLQVDVPYHSDRMDVIREELEASLRGLRSHTPTTPFFSTVTGSHLETPVLDASYWWNNVRRPVAFATAMKSLVSSGAGVFVEIGAHPVLMNSMLECVGNATKGAVVPTLRRGEAQLHALQSALGSLYTLGRPIRWNSVYPTRRPVSRLPAYPWQRESFWFDENAVGPHKANGEGAHQLLAPTHFTLLGNAVESAHKEHAWHTSISVDAEHLWLADHRVQGVPLFPAAGFVDQALSAGQRLHPSQPLCLERIEVAKALALTPGRPTPVETVVDVASGDFKISSRDPQGNWTAHAWGKVRVDHAAWDDSQEALHEFDSRCASVYDVEALYGQFAAIGLEYGPDFRAIESIRTGPSLAMGRVRLKEDLLSEVDHSTFCAPLLDACMQIMLAAATSEADDDHSLSDGRLYLPARVHAVRIHDPAALANACRTSLSVGCRICERTDEIVRADAILFDDSGIPVVIVDGFEAVAFRTPRRESLGLEDCLLEHQWILSPRDGQSSDEEMPSPSELAAAVSNRVASIQNEIGDGDISTELVSLLDAQATAFAVRALQELRCEWTIGQPIEIDQLAESLGIASNQKNLFFSVIQRIAQSGLARVQGGNVEAVAPLCSIDLTDLWQRICRRWPAMHAVQLLTWKLGTNLAAILQACCRIDDHIAPAEMRNLQEQIQDDAPGSRVHNRLLQEIYVELERRLPAERPLRMLEIGSISIFTSTIAPLFPSERIACEFIEASVVTNEFKYDSPFDVVICDSHSSTGNVSSLLLSNGIVICRENNFFGPIDEGWICRNVTRFCDIRDARRSFEATTLENVARVRHIAIDDQLAWNIALARPQRSADVKASSGSVTDLTKSTSAVWWLVGDNTSFANALASRLTQAGGAAVTISHGETYRRLDADHYELPLDDSTSFAEVLKASVNDGMFPEAIIHLASLHDPTGDDVTLETMRQSQSRGMNSVLAVAQAVARSDAGSVPRLWLTTSRVQAVGLAEGSSLSLASAPTWGLARVLSNEMPQLKCTVIDLSDDNSAAEVESLFDELSSNGDEREIALRGRRRYVPRLRLATPPRPAHEAGSNFRVAVTARGALDSTVLVPADRTQPGADEVEIEVDVSAVNFKDMAKALNLLSDETVADTWSGTTLGLECAGRVVAVGANVSEFHVGDRVAALASDCFRRYVTTRSAFVTRLPDSIAIEDAAGIPVVFLTAWYALRQLADVQPEERVVVHAAAGGVGLAAIQIAKLAGAKVIATAGSSLKRDYLRAIGVEHVFDSRSLSFVDDIRSLTGGEGVDIVINSLAGAAIPASLSLLRAGGRFVEIGKRDIQDNEALALRPFQNNLSFFALDLDRLLSRHPQKARRLLDAVMTEFSNGTLAPLPRHIFPVTRVGDALRHMAKARQIGKVVLDMRDPVAPQCVQRTSDSHQVRFSSDGTYLVTGGCSGFGLATAKWLLEHGVRNLALLSRHGAKTLEAQQEILELELAGARVLTLSVDVADEKQLAAALTNIRSSLPPIEGVFHAAMVLDDAMALQLSPDRMEAVMAPKAWGAWNLHQLTSDDPLKHFVLFSSATTVFGNPGQANYVAACTFLDQLAHQRRTAGRPALSVAWGAIADVGYLSQNKDVLKHIEERLGFKPLPAGKMLGFLEQLIQTEMSQVAVAAVNWSQFSPAKFAVAGAPRMAALVQRLSSTSEVASGTIGKLRETLAAALPEERRALLLGMLKKSVAGVLGTSPENVPVDQSLLAMGLDSLMAVELQMGLSRELESEISPMQLLRGPTIQELTDELLAAFAEKA